VKVFFKSRQAPGHFWPIREEVQPGDSVAFLNEVIFLIDPGSCLARDDSHGEFQKKRFNEAVEITSGNRDTREQYSLINFHSRLIEGIW